jgi:quinoprotein glucose dehydrogenase
LLYFAVGDRGIDRESTRRINGIPSGIDLTRTGAVYSCELDGSNWSLLAWGLRAPADLAFNDLGDLFVTAIVPTQREAVDSAPGDEGLPIVSRIYQVTPGADFGWRAGYSIPLRIKSTAAWTAEKNSFLALAPADNRTPPITTFPNQITGMAFTPGGSGFENEMGAESNGSTLVWSEVNSSWDNGSISLATINLKGTAYTMGRSEKILSPITAMDLVFDWQGGILLADWTPGKEAPYKGRIFRVFSTNETERLGPAGLDRFLNLRPELDKQSWLNWLSHPDSRVRSMAKSSIAQRGQEWMSELETLLKASTLTTDAKSQLQAKEAVRAMGLIAKQSPQAVNVLIQLARHPNAAIRAEIASALGKISGSASIPVLMQGIQDVDPRVRRLSVESLGLLKVKEAIAPILDRARTIDGQDPQLRQSFVFALSNMATPDQLAKESTNSSASIRLVATLALQRIEGAAAQVFLWDENPRVATEAARSVYSDPNRQAFQRLADRIATPMDSSSLAYRALWAHHRLGDPIRARALAFFAANPNAPESLRIEALQALSLWGKTLDRDPITGRPGWTPWFQSTPEEVEQTVNRAMSPYVNSLRQDASIGVKDFFQSWRSPKIAPEESSSVPEGESKDASGVGADSAPEGGTESSDEKPKTEENVKVIKT